MHLDGAARPLLGRIEAPTDGEPAARHTLSVRGWAIDPDGPLDAIVVRLNGRPTAVAHVGIPRPDVARAHPRFADASRAGWNAEVDLSEVAGKTAELAVDVLRAGGGWATLARVTVPLVELATRELEQVREVQDKIAPLRLQVSATTPERVNLIIPTLDLKVFFGGYAGKLNLANRLAKEGFRVRLVLVDYFEHKLSSWKEEIQSYPGLDGVFDRVEVLPAFDRSTRIEVNPADVFIATTWWSAQIAHRASRELGRQRFLYFIQEYEPFTFPMGTFAALASETYDLPHYAVFSTELLREYFRMNRLGVFADSTPAGDSASVAFENAITPVEPVSVADIADRRPRRLLFYARPEQHASRNMFELGVWALSEAIDTGLFADGWELRGIGTLGTSSRLQLPRGHFLELVPRQAQGRYGELLRAHDLGLSLMYTPHPSLVPLEMASAGMVAVTNTYANKTADRLRAISPNILGVSPTVEGIKLGLAEAVTRVADYEGRVRGSTVAWSSSWDRSFNPEIMARIREFLSLAR